MNIEIIIDPIIALQISGGKYKPDDKFLLVEGTTDKEFIEKLGVEKLQSIPVGTIIEDEYRLKRNEKKPYAKPAILDTVREKNKENFFGLVDKDFATEEDINNYHEHILVTPTHDLETFLLSTDNDIFKEPDNITEDLKDALYYAYLIGIIKKRMIEGEIYYKNNNNFEDVLGEEIKLRDLIEFLIDESKGITIRKILELEREIKKDIPVDKDGFITLYKEDVIHNKDLYDIANGHDILNIMKSLCEKQIKRLIDAYHTEDHRDRAVEFAVIERYNFGVFERSKFFKDMKKLIPVF